MGTRSPRIYHYSILPVTNTDVLKWIKREIGPYIQRALLARPESTYTEDWLAGIACRETGQLMAIYIPKKSDPLTICSILRGDYTQRHGETEKQYHGYGITQVDSASFPAFIKSGDWKDPFKCFVKSIDILNGKKDFLLSEYPMLWGEELDELITAAYNCGEGNESKLVLKTLDPDVYTTQHNYSKAVFEFAEIYKTL